jgi:glycosyltransferase involved in cell wall biosynthesis
LSSKRNIQVILAPRGEVAGSAVKIKSYKKAPFLKFAKWFRLYDDIKWHASSEFEAENVHGMFDDGHKIAKVKFAPNVVVAPDLPEKLTDIQLQTPTTHGREKKQNKLNIVFLARIARMKNLDGALKMLQSVCGEIKFDIYGPLEDREYWAECENLIRALPPNVEVQYKGHVNREDVHTVMSSYHLFFLPTLGENFGHVILEALIAGCPVLISDRTPWRDLEKKGVGWEIPLDEPERFQTVLHKCVEMDQESLAALSRQAKDFAKEIANDENNLMLNRNLFLEA